MQNQHLWSPASSQMRRESAHSKDRHIDSLKTFLKEEISLAYTVHREPRLFTTIGKFPNNGRKIGLVTPIWRFTHNILGCILRNFTGGTKNCLPTLRPHYSYLPFKYKMSEHIWYTLKSGLHITTLTQKLVITKTL